LRAGALFLTLWLPSLPVLVDHLPPWLVLGHGLLTFAGALAWLRERPRLGRAWDLALAALLYAALAIAFALVYPVADAGRFGGGSDRDDALGQAASALLDGRYPYYERTYLDNPVTPLPGAVLFSLPFAVADVVPMQSLLWLGAFCVALARRGNVLATLALVTLGSPAVTHDVLTGGDLVANTLYVLAGVVAVAECRGRMRWPAYLFLGLALSSRPTFWLLLPPLAVHLAKRSRGSVEAIATVVLATSAVTLPFYVYDPSSFTPFHVLGKLEGARALFPGGDYAVIGLALALVLVASRAVGEATSSLSRVQAFALWIPPVLAAAAGGQPDLLYFALPAGIFAARGR
jgi:hypothetical protein